MKTANKLIGALAASMLTCASAQAALITEWGFELDSAFTDYVGGQNITEDNTNAFYNAPTYVAWGTGTDKNPGLQSSFNLGAGTNGNLVGDVDTNGAFVDTLELTHNNWEIKSGGAITGATLSTRLSLSAKAIDGFPIDPILFPDLPQQIFDINFKETKNSGDCVVDDDGPKCSDILVININDAGGFNPISGAFEQSFVIDGYKYTAQVKLDGLTTLEDSVCAAANAGSGCIGLTTKEQQSNSFQGSFAIAATFVSEPAAIALLGLSLIGLGGFRRFKK
ncbi:PEP-CTERM sorting domain-containing protein [Alteromonas sediminis]|uniref:PEP-CTERM sorting domain-containing protein n=1 Tax=Alteromonas sediminis TaxID=2259342 RepID=A0A3N5YAD5_9ALTE|nr:THxN family PEP-CTERM protein [Alteromonas sediminis]RPJ65715.1 PEP-CTERM sorting domain-containing protein [Alteromonas sediminis]